MTRHFNPMVDLFNQPKPTPPAPVIQAAVGEEYVRVHCYLMFRKEKSVRLSAGGHDPGLWIPRSCIHGADECELDKANIGAALDLRIFKWKARQEGMA